MPLHNCPDCGRQISDTAKACPNCGRPVAPNPQASRNKMILAWVLIVVGLLATKGRVLTSVGTLVFLIGLVMLAQLYFLNRRRR